MRAATIALMLMIGSQVGAYWLHGRFKNFGVATLFCVVLVAAADYFGPSKGHPYYEAYSRILDAGVIGGASALAIWLLILMISAPFLLIAHFKNKSGEPKEKESFHENRLKISNPTESTTKKCPFCAEEIMASTIKCKHCSEMMSGQFKAAPVIENILSPAVSNLNVQPENKEKAKYDATDLLETKKLENRFFSVITSSEAQIEAEKKVQSTQLESRRHHLPWRDILAAAILLLCVGTFAWAVNSILQFFG